MNRHWIIGSGLVAIVAMLVGCGPAAAPNPKPENPPAKGTAGDGHAHDGWWCAEHGVPEGVCAQCDTKLVADFKKKGDWCDKHNRPDSQCFICHPENFAKFAEQYEVKYGTKPPKPDEG